jgi:RNA polymerase sigma factor (sigma-70 family)
MATIRLGTLVRRIRTLAAPPGADESSDAELLRRFLDAHDEAAFVGLLRRHGPMVRDVCHRLCQEADADDAFQATFLLLWRKAASIRRRPAVASWLHGVARRIALHARQVGQVPTRVDDRIDPSADDPARLASWREVCAILDAEVQGLSDKYRAPLILCYFEGRTRDQVARQLGWSLRTLHRRLQRGRELLRARLSRRGIALPAALVAAALAPRTAGAISPALLASTLSVVRGGAAGTGVAGTSAAARVARLVQGTAATVSVAPGKVAAAVLVLAVGVLAAGWAAWTATAPAPPSATAPDAQPAPRAVRELAAADGAPKQERTDRYGDPLPEGALVRLGTVRFRNSSAPALLAFRPGTRQLLSVSGGDEGVSVRLWDARTGKVLRDTRTPLPAGVSDAAVSSDSKYLAVAWYDRYSDKPLPLAPGGVALWDGTRGKELRPPPRLDKPVTCLAVADGGKLLATGDLGGFIHLWDVPTGRELRRCEGRRGTWGRLAFAPDGKSLASVDFTKAVLCFWDVAAGTERRTLTLSKGALAAAAFSPDWRRLATAAGRGEKVILLWNLASGKEIRRIDVPSETVSLAFAADGKLLASGDLRTDAGATDVTVRLWNVRTGKELRRLPMGVFAVSALAFTSDGTRLATGGRGLSPVARVWDVASGKPAVDFPERDVAVGSAAYSPDGRMLVTGDGVLDLWDPATGRRIRRIGAGAGSLYDPTFSADGRYLAAEGEDGIFRLWEPATGKEVRHWRVREKFSWLGFDLSPDGRALATGGNDGTIRFWELATGKEIRRIAVQDRPANIQFSPDGRFLAWLSLGVDKLRWHLRLWDVAGGKEVRRWSAAHGYTFRFSSDGKLLAGVELTKGACLIICHLWDVATGRDRPITLSLPRPAYAGAMAFSPDGRTLALGDSTGVIYLWELAAGKVRCRLQAPGGTVFSLAFAPDGKTLVSGLYDTTALLWDVFGPTPQGQQRRTPDAADLPRLWADLADRDAVKAYQAVGRLVSAPELAVLFLGRHLKPAAPVAAEDVQRLITDLASRDFKVRQKATRALEKRREQAEPLLRQALADRPEPEVRHRLEALVENTGGPVADREVLQLLRAVEVLEHIATPDAPGRAARCPGCPRGPPDAGGCGCREAAGAPCARRAETGRHAAGRSRPALKAWPGGHDAPPAGAIALGHSPSFADRHGHRTTLTWPGRSAGHRRLS